MGYIYDARMTLHKNELIVHDERPERIKSIHKFNLLRRVFKQYNWIEVRRCDRDYLKQIHSEFYLQRQKSIQQKLDDYKVAVDKKIKIEQREALKKKLESEAGDDVKDLNEMMKALNLGPSQVEELTEDDESMLSIPKRYVHYNFSQDTFENVHTFEAAVLSASGVKTAIEHMFPALSGLGDSVNELNRVFCNVRPPGHHSLGNAKCEASGFCFFNNVALGAKYAVDKLGLSRVLILDWDVHHGDGTQVACYDDPRILFISLHRFEEGMFYPGSSGAKENTGEGKGEGYNINVEWNTKEGYGKKSKLGDQEYIFMFENLIRPVVSEFNPELIMVSSGFDSADHDPLGKISNTPDTYAYYTYHLKQMCPKLLVVLEGGYNLFALSVSSENVLRGLAVDGFDNLPEDADKYFCGLNEKYKERPRDNVHGK